MHFHALNANEYGDEPTALSTLIETSHPTHDFCKSHEVTWFKWLKTPECEKLKWSTKGDDDLKKQTFDFVRKI